MKISLIGILLLAASGMQSVTGASVRTNVWQQSHRPYTSDVATGKSSYYQEKNSVRQLPPLRRVRRSEEAERSYNLGTRNALSGHYEEAVKNFTQAIRFNSEDADAYFSLGNAYVGLRRWAEAIDSYQRSIRLNPNDGEAYNNIGIAYLRGGAPKQAVAAFKEAIRIFPTWAEPRFNLSNAYSKLGQTDDAAASYRRAIQLRPDYSSRASLGAAPTQTTDVFPQRGSSSSNNTAATNNTATSGSVAANNEARKNVAASKTNVVKSELPVKSNSAKSFYNLGVKYGRAGRYRESVEAFKQAINLKPDYIDAYYGLGHAYSDLGRSKEAISAYEKILELDSKEVEAYTMIGRVYANLRAQTAANDPVTKETAADNNASHSVASNAVAPPLTAPIIAAPADASNAAPTSSVDETKTNVNTSTAMPQPETSRASATNGDLSKTSEASKTAVTTAPNAANGTLAKPEATLSTDTEVAKSASTSTNAVDPKDPTSIYRVGRGDVLDIQLLNAETRRSTLFTVTAAGLLEYSLIREPLPVAGLTTDEIAARLESELKRRGIQENPKVTVGVHEYLSHNVIVSGLVSEPGEKGFRREAIPLYVVIADAQPRPEAGQAVIIAHNGGRRTIVDLTDSRAMSKLVFPGDVINVQKKSEQFFYIGGNVRVPGQKVFHPGITLTQAVLGAGRKLSDGGNVNVTRQNESGLLATTTYSLQSIVAGKTPDPPVQANDRIEVAP
jgi:tetratricopeptide (TPR) repeat protein/protein involved in polysaccharide export with SLBB domain